MSFLHQPHISRKGVPLKAPHLGFVYRAGASTAGQGIVNPRAASMKILLLLAIIATIMMLAHVGAGVRAKADRAAAAG